MEHYVGWVCTYFGWMGVGGKISWLGGGEWGLVHCLKMPDFLLCLHAQQSCTVFKILCAPQLSVIATSFFTFLCTSYVILLTVIYYKYLGL